MNETSHHDQRRHERDMILLSELLRRGTLTHVSVMKLRQVTQQQIIDTSSHRLTAARAVLFTRRPPLVLN